MLWFFCGRKWKRCEWGKRDKKTLKQKHSSFSLVCAKQNREIPHGQTKTAMQTQHRNVITKMLFYGKQNEKKAEEKRAHRMKILKPNGMIYFSNRDELSKRKKSCVHNARCAGVVERYFLKWFCVRQLRDLLIFDGKASGHRIFILVYKVWSLKLFK